MCINLTNEQLQMYFNKNVFDAELHECMMEGVLPVGVIFTDNQPTIDLFLKVSKSKAYILENLLLCYIYLMLPNFLPKLPYLQNLQRLHKTSVTFI